MAHFRFFPLAFLDRLITIYDVKIELKWSGKASDGTEVNGKLVIPEVSHEVTLDGLSEYEVRFPFIRLRFRASLLIHYKVQLDTLDEIVQTRRRSLQACQGEAACCTGNQVCRVPGRDHRDACEGSDRERGAQSHRYSSATYERNFYHHGCHACTQTRGEEPTAKGSNHEHVDGGGRSYIYGCS